MGHHHDGDYYRWRRLAVVGVVPSHVADLLRVVRLLWAGRNPLLGQKKGNGVRPNRTASIDGDAASHDGAHGEASDDDAHYETSLDGADGHSSQGCADAVHGGTRAPLLIGSVAVLSDLSDPWILS